MRFHGHLDGLLDDVVAILICEVVLERPGFHDFGDHLAANVRTCALQALLDNVRGELFLAQSEQRTEQL